MKPSEKLNLYRKEIREIVMKNRAKNVKYFGSVLHGNDTEQSDLDLLIEPTDKTTLFDIGAICHQLENLLDIEVDVLTPKALPEKFRNKVLQEAQLV